MEPSDLLKGKSKTYNREKSPANHSRSQEDDNLNLLSQCKNEV